MIKPMLAATLKADQVKDLTFPLYASAKLDGIRAIVLDGKFYSRNGKLIPNEYIQSYARMFHNGWDGELIVGDPTDKMCYRNTVSGVMTESGLPDFTFHVFDEVTVKHYGQRNTDLSFKCHKLFKRDYNAFIGRLVHVYQEIVLDAVELFGVEEDCLKRGYEGIMVRSPSGGYKHGRCTHKEHNLWKLKRFNDSEAIILEVFEQLENTNEKTTDELGRSKRSSHKANKIGKNTLGGFVVRDVKSAVEFAIGSGFTDEERKILWGKKKQLLGQTVKYKYFPVGAYEAPRFPVFLGMRKD